MKHVFPKLPVENKDDEVLDSMPPILATNLTMDLSAVYSWFDRQIQRWRPYMLIWARKFLRDEAVVEDVIQRTWMKLYLLVRQRGVLGTPDSVFLESLLQKYHLSRWLQITVKNDALNYLKEQKRLVHLDPSEALIVLETRGAREPSPEMALTYRETQRDFLLLLQQIPSNHRRVVFLHLYENYSFEEIAQKLGMPSSTVRSWFFRGHEHLRRIFDTRISQDDLLLLLQYSLISEE